MEKDSEMELALLRQDFENLRDELRGDIKDLRDDVKDLVAAWRATGLAGKFVKWIAGIATAVVGLWAVAKGYVVR